MAGRFGKASRLQPVISGCVGLLPVMTFVQACPPPVLGEEARQADPAERKIRRLESLAEGQQAQIQSLKSRLGAVERRSHAAVRAEDVRRIAGELMADARFREGLYPDVQQVGYDRGFYIRSADEAFLLKVNGFAHVRWTGQNRQTDNPRRQGRQKQDDVNAFEIEDLRLIFRGHIHSPRLTYMIITTGGTDQANDWRTWHALASYAFAEELELTAGLFKVPFGRQERVPKMALQFVERSLANEMFNLDRSISMMMHGTLAKRLSYAAAISNGFGDPRDSPSRERTDTNVAYAGRVVAHILGEAIETESDLAFSKDPKLEVGFSLGYSDDNGDRRPSVPHAVPDRIRAGRGIGGNAMADLTGADLLQFGTDVAFRYRGFSATAEYWLRSVDGDDEFSDWERSTGRDDATHQQGAYVQAGYFIVPKKVEVVARLGGVWDNDGDDVWECTLGVNYFPWGSYNVLLQADVTRIAEAPSPSSAANWSQNDEVNMVRVQLQVKF